MQGWLTNHLVVALKALNRPVFLIDEPEAFLHPPQAFRMVDEWMRLWRDLEFHRRQREVRLPH